MKDSFRFGVNNQNRVWAKPFLNFSLFTQIAFHFITGRRVAVPYKKGCGRSPPLTVHYSLKLFFT